MKMFDDLTIRRFDILTIRHFDNNPTVKQSNGLTIIFSLQKT